MATHHQQGDHKWHLGQNGHPKTFNFGNLVEHEDLVTDGHTLAGDVTAVVGMYGENILYTNNRIMWLL